MVQRVHLGMVQRNRDVEVVTLVVEDVEMEVAVADAQPGMVTQMNVQEAKTRLSQILARVERGEDVVIARDGVPIVRLLPIGPPPSRPVGFVTGSVPDAFFDPLPDVELDAWG